MFGSVIKLINWRSFFVRIDQYVRDVCTVGLFNYIIKFPAVVLDPTKEVIIIGIHEASRTGAPILGWNIIVSLKRKNIIS